MGRGARTKPISLSSLTHGAFVRWRLARRLFPLLRGRASVYDAQVFRPGRPSIRRRTEVGGRWLALGTLLLWATSAGPAQASAAESSPAIVQTLPPPAPGSAETEPPPSPSPADQDPAPSPDNGAFDTVEEQVQQRVTRARLAFTAGQYDAAQLDLEAAYKLKSNANYLFSIAQCHRRSGRNRQALSVYQRFLKADPATALKLETMSYISELNILISQDDAIQKEKKRPIWKKGSFWAILASATVAAGVALGVGLGVGLRDNTETIGFQVPKSSSASALTSTRAWR